MSDEIRAIVEYLRCSKYRLIIFKYIARKPNIPSRIACDLNIDKSIVSRILKQLRNKQLIYSVFPELRKGRIFFLTPIGKEIYQFIEKNNINMDFT